MKGSKKDKDSIYEVVKSLREKRGFTQLYVAKRLVMDQAGYSQLETGKTKMTVEKLREIAEVYEMSVASLFDEDFQKIKEEYLELFAALLKTNEENAPSDYDDELEDMGEESEVVINSKKHLQAKLIEMFEEQIKTKNKINQYQNKEIEELKSLLSRVAEVSGKKKIIKSDLLKQIQKKTEGVS